MITSKDAYMLIYAKRDSAPFSGGDHKDPTLFQQPEPPNRAMKVVRYFNDEHTAACNAYVDKYICAFCCVFDVQLMQSPQRSRTQSSLY